MNKDKALDKIKKLLRLSKSNNPNEAAAAMRQAQAMMREHGIDHADIDASIAKESRAKSGSMKRPVSWEVSLVNMVADCFSCCVILRTGFTTRGEYAFIGVDAKPEIAVYAFEVLRRQCRRGRAEYISTALRRCGPASKTRRADEFCLGWVVAARRHVIPLVPSEQERQAIVAYTAKHYPEVRDTQGVRRKGKARDFEFGYEDGANARLDRGMPGVTTSQLECRE